MSFNMGALLEPLSVALAGIRRAELRLGQPCLIAGAGAVGLLAVALANAGGATPVIVTDINEGRLKIAKDLGATHIINSTGKTPEQIAEEVLEATGEADRPEVAIECSGVESSIQSAALVCYTCFTARKLSDTHIVTGTRLWRSLVTNWSVQQGKGLIPFWSCHGSGGVWC